MPSWNLCESTKNHACFKGFFLSLSLKLESFIIYISRHCICVLVCVCIHDVYQMRALISMLLPHIQFTCFSPNTIISNFVLCIKLKLRQRDKAKDQPKSRNPIHWMRIYHFTLLQYVYIHIIYIHGYISVHRVNQVIPNLM